MSQTVSCMSEVGRFSQDLFWMVQISGPIKTMDERDIVYWQVVNTSALMRKALHKLTTDWKKRKANGKDDQ